MAIITAALIGAGIGGLISAFNAVKGANSANEKRAAEAKLIEAKEKIKSDLNKSYIENRDSAKKLTKQIFEPGGILDSYDIPSDFKDLITEQIKEPIYEVADLQGDESFLKDTIGESKGRGAQDEALDLFRNQTKEGLNENEQTRLKEQDSSAEQKMQEMMRKGQLQQQRMGRTNSGSDFLQGLVGNQNLAEQQRKNQQMVQNQAYQRQMGGAGALASLGGQVTRQDMDAATRDLAETRNNNAMMLGQRQNEWASDNARNLRNANEATLGKNRYYAAQNAQQDRRYNATKNEQGYHRNQANSYQNQARGVGREIDNIKMNRTGAQNPWVEGAFGAGQGALQGGQAGASYGQKLGKAGFNLDGWMTPKKKTNPTTGVYDKTTYNPWNKENVRLDTYVKNKGYKIPKK